MTQDQREVLQICGLLIGWLLLLETIYRSRRWWSTKLNMTSEETRRAAEEAEGIQQTLKEENEVILQRKWSEIEKQLKMTSSFTPSQVQLVRAVFLMGASTVLKEWQAVNGKEQRLQQLTHEVLDTLRDE